MEVIIDGIAEAFRLIARMDQEVFEVVFTSLKVSLLSLVIAASNSDCGTQIQGKASFDEADLYFNGDAAGAVRAYGIFILYAQGTVWESAAELYGGGDGDRPDAPDPSYPDRAYGQRSARTAGEDHPPE